MRGMQEKIIFGRRDRLGAGFHNRLFPGFLSFLEPGKVFYIFVADGSWTGQAAARLKITRATIHRCDGQKWQRANDILLNARPLGRSVKLLLVLKSQRSEER